MHQATIAAVAALVLLLIAWLPPSLAEGPVRVFVLAGQSNMVGAGEIAADPARHAGRGSLEWLVQDPAKAASYGHLVDDRGQWKAREDVKIWSLGRTGNLAPGFGGNPATIGPELGFGHAVGEALDEPVLLIKLAWGGKSLGRDFRPPGSGGDVGPYYRTLIDQTRLVLEDAGRLFPEFAQCQLVLTGFGWHQGWNDRVNQTLNDEYESNLAHLIRDVRRDLGVPDLPFVIAETGMSGREEKHPRALSLMAAQAAVARYPEFQGNVAFVETRDFYRPPEVSPARQAYHWNRNAETYYLIGKAMGEAMMSLAKR